MSGLPEKLSNHKGVSFFQSTVRDKEKMFLKTLNRLRSNRSNLYKTYFLCPIILQQNRCGGVMSNALMSNVFMSIAANVAML